MHLEVGENRGYLAQYLHNHVFSACDVLKSHGGWSGGALPGGCLPWPVLSAHSEPHVVCLQGAPQEGVGLSTCRSLPVAESLR